MKKGLLKNAKEIQVIRISEAGQLDATDLTSDSLMLGMSWRRGQS